MITKWVRGIMQKLGYFCPSCSRIKKTFSPPFGNKVCLSCQLKDADDHLHLLNDISIRRGANKISDNELGLRLKNLKKTYLPRRP